MKYFIWSVSFHREWELCEASKEGNLDRVRQLLDEGVAVNASPDWVCHLTLEYVVY